MKKKFLLAMVAIFCVSSVNAMSLSVEMGQDILEMPTPFITMHYKIKTIYNEGDEAASKTGRLVLISAESLDMQLARVNRSFSYVENQLHQNYEDAVTTASFEFGYVDMDADGGVVVPESCRSFNLGPNNNKVLITKEGCTVERS